MSDEEFLACRRRLLGIAYGLLGELGEAEDVVQDAWLRWDGVDRGSIRDPEAFLVTVTTRLAIKRLGSARARRELYVGPWLPDPLLTDPDDPESMAVEAELLDLALLGALERLNPNERAVLVLRDVFDFEYAEIAEILDKTPANLRQIAKRAREHAGDPGRRRAVSDAQREQLATAFMAAALAGDVAGLRDLLAADAIMYSDGGGQVVTARKPIYGAEKIARFMVSIQRKDAFPSEPVFTRVLVNGDPGVLMEDAEAGFLSIISIEIADQTVQTIRFFQNPSRFSAPELRANVRSYRRPGR